MKRTIFLLTALVASSTLSSAALIAPNDSSIAGNLIGWFSDPGTSYNASTGIWTDMSGNGNNTATVPTTNALTLSGGAITGGMLNGQTIDYLATINTLNEELISTTLNSGTGLGQFTIIALVSYVTPDVNGIHRALGFGSKVDGGSLSNNFNLAGDGSIRKDNGFIAGSGPVPYGEFFVRANNFNAGVFNDFYITGAAAGITSVNIANGNFGAATVATDEFFFGDLNLGSFNNQIAQVAIYNTSLTQTQIEDVAEFMAANPNFKVVPEPSSTALFGLGGLALMLRRRR